MKGNKLSIRLSRGLIGIVSRQAAERGITRTSRAARLIERGLAIEALEGLLGAADRQAAPDAPGVISDELLDIQELVAFTAFYTQEMLQALNVALNRSAAEVGRIAATARDRATAQTKVFLSRRSRKR